MRASFILGLALTTVLRATSAQNVDIGDLLEAAKTDYETNHLDSALTKLNERDKAKGASSQSLDLRGSIALEQGKLAEAARAFEAARKLQPDLFAPRLHLGDLDLREKKYGEAREIYENLAAETNILISSERVRYALLVVALAAHDQAAAKEALENIKFPTETPAYYFAQAASEFAHHNDSSAEQWLAAAQKIFDRQSFAWFARPLYDLGWLKQKPPPPTI